MKQFVNHFILLGVLFSLIVSSARGQMNTAYLMEMDTIAPIDNSQRLNGISVITGDQYTVTYSEWGSGKHFLLVSFANNLNYLFTKYFEVDNGLYITDLAAYDKKYVYMGGYYFNDDGDRIGFVGRLDITYIESDTSCRFAYAPIPELQSVDKIHAYKDNNGIPLLAAIGIHHDGSQKKLLYHGLYWNPSQTYSYYLYDVSDRFFLYDVISTDNHIVFAGTTANMDSIVIYKSLIRYGFHLNALNAITHIHPINGEIYEGPFNLVASRLDEDQFVIAYPWGDKQQPELHVEHYLYQLPWDYHYTKQTVAIESKSELKDMSWMSLARRLAILMEDGSTHDFRVQTLDPYRKNGYYDRRWIMGSDRFSTISTLSGRFVLANGEREKYVLFDTIHEYLGCLQRIYTPINPRSDTLTIPYSLLQDNNDEFTTSPVSGSTKLYHKKNRGSECWCYTHEAPIITPFTEKEDESE